VLYLEGSEHADYRLLKGMKNRFGSTSEVGVFSMDGQRGMVDVANPSELFMSSAVVKDGSEGAAVSVVLEGTRPILAEVQCLVGNHNGMKMSPRRTTDGFALPRLQLICAVLEKRMGLDLGQRDVYLNVVGGLKLSEPAADLAVAVTIVSSLLGVKVKAGVAFVGELGLGGEIRGGKGLDARVAEALNMGFNQVVVPVVRKGKGKGAAGGSGSAGGGQSGVVACSTIRQALEAALDTADLDALLRKKRQLGGEVSEGRTYGGGGKRFSRYSRQGRGGGGGGDDGDYSDADAHGNEYNSWKEELQ
jgi:predicted ATP-dependent serine protease